MVASGHQPVARRADLNRRAVSTNIFKRQQVQPRRAVAPIEDRQQGRLAKAAVSMVAGAALVGGVSFLGAEPAAAKPIGYGWVKLHKGDSGRAVVRLQRELSAYGPNVSDTGYFGKKTRARVKQLQRKNGWKATGRVGNRVWHELLTDGHRVSSPALVKRATPKRVSRSTTSRPALSSSNTVWDRLAQCEAGGNWHINTGNGFYGGLQFTLSTWHAYGGSGMPNNASRAEQIRIAEKVQRGQGWGAWPACSSRLGLR